MFNMDFSQRVVIRSAELDRATSIVKCEPGASFQTHEHSLGEEVLVLSGEFIDEHGRYPAGTWLRSPHEYAYAVS